MNTLQIELHSYAHINDLWPRLVEKIGSDKAQRAVKQALDLQCMHGGVGTIAVLLFETCGIALISAEALSYQTGLQVHGSHMVLLASVREESIQLIRHF